MIINGNDISKFVVIVGNDNISWLVLSETEKLLKAISEKTGNKTELQYDTKTEESEYEIIIGNANRTGVKTQSCYNYGDYEIRICGKKVYISGGSVYAVQVAVTEFTEMLNSESINDSDSKTGSYDEAVAKYDSKNYYKLVWGDEFDSDTLDPKKWIITEGINPGSVGPTNMVVNEKTFRMENSNAIMSAFPNDEGGFDHCNAIMTDNKMRFHGGYLEMKAQIPLNRGAYSSFWGNGRDAENQDDLLEIDLFESFGWTYRRHANIHKWCKNGEHTSLEGVVEKRYYDIPQETTDDHYYTIGMLWNDKEIHFYFDGNEYYSQPLDDFFKNKYINVTAGFNVGWKDRAVPAEDTVWPLEYRVDYIRLFQIDGQDFITKE